jgi:hypothetical protein
LSEKGSKNRENGRRRRKQTEAKLLIATAAGIVDVACDGDNDDDRLLMNSTKSSPVNIAEATYNKAVKAEVARDYNKAYHLYAETAELYLNLVRLLPEQSAKWKTNAGKAIGRAEKIKQFASTQQSVHLTPPTLNYFAERIYPPRDVQLNDKKLTTPM